MPFSYIWQVCKKRACWFELVSCLKCLQKRSRTCLISTRHKQGVSRYKNNTGFISFRESMILLRNLWLQLTPEIKPGINVSTTVSHKYSAESVDKNSWLHPFKPYFVMLPSHRVLNFNSAQLYLLLFHGCADKLKMLLTHNNLRLSNLLYRLCQTAASPHIQQTHGQMFSVIYSVVSVPLINHPLLSCCLGLQQTLKEISRLDNQVLANCIGFLIYWRWSRVCSDLWHRRARLYSNLCKTSTRVLDTHRETTAANILNSLMQMKVQAGFFQDFTLHHLWCRLSHWQNRAHLVIHKLTVLGYCFGWKQQGNKQHGQLCFGTIQDNQTPVGILIFKIATRSCKGPLRTFIVLVSVQFSRSIYDRRRVLNVWCRSSVCMGLSFFPMFGPFYSLLSCTSLLNL